MFQNDVEMIFNLSKTEQKWFSGASKRKTATMQQYFP
jgi:hypothetical protein